MKPEKENYVTMIDPAILIRSIQHFYGSHITLIGIFGNWNINSFTPLYQVDDTEVISFLLSTEIIPLCLRTMEMGSELSKTVEFPFLSFHFFSICICVIRSSYSLLYRVLPLLLEFGCKVCNCLTKGFLLAGGHIYCSKDFVRWCGLGLYLYYSWAVFCSRSSLGNHGSITCWAAFIALIKTYYPMLSSIVR